MHQNKLEMPDQLKDLLQEVLASVVSQDQKLISQKRELLGGIGKFKKA